RNAGTPLLTASTPVIAVHPLAKDRRSSHAPAVATTDGGGGGATTGTGWPPCAAAFATPSAITTKRQTRKVYVGVANAIPVLRGPRRLTRQRSARTPRQSGSVY